MKDHFLRCLAAILNLTERKKFFRTPLQTRKEVGERGAGCQLGQIVNSYLTIDLEGILRRPLSK